jgi:hypothetical protein
VDQPGAARRFCVCGFRSHCNPAENAIVDSLGILSRIFFLTNCYSWYILTFSYSYALAL